MEINRDEAQRRIAFLRETLEENSRRYYVDNAPTISDFEFDALMHELEDLERQWPEFRSADSPTARVGSDLAAKTEFIQRPHKYPMLSLANTYSITEIEEFAARAEKILSGEKFSYCCELKFDGTAICLTYREGRLVRALTRGDGSKGDDVTVNALRIANIPKQLKGDFPDEFEIRGEVLMPYEAFDRLNAERVENEEPPFANPRNAASGSLKLTDPEEVARRGLICTLYHIPAQSISFETHDEAMNKAASWGLPISGNRRLCHGIEDIREFISHWDKERKFLPYATDGCVIKINELTSQRSLGYTSKSPRWAVAFKFQAERACTRVTGIDYQLGRTGAVTPVANLEPVQLSGTVVKRATLNNEGWMRSLDVHIGDSVYVEKGGEIIPKITGVELSMRPSDAVLPEFPKTCPECGTPLVKDDEEARWFCPNTDDCPPQICARLVHFMSRKAMNVLAGDATAQQLFEAGLVRCPADLYDINMLQLLALDGWQEKSARNFIDSLARTKEVPFERVLFALGIRFTGETKAKALARHFGDIESLCAASVEQMLEVEDIGERIAHCVFDYLHDAKHLDEIARLRSHGLQFACGKAESALSSALEGKTIVVSGNFSISRDAMKELIVRHGGKCASGVSGKTSFLLAGSKPGPEKISKCGQLGIPVVSEDEFLAMIPEERSEVGQTEEEPTLF